MASVPSIPTLFEHQLGIYRFEVACYALYVYEHAITLSDEVSKIWSRKLTLVNASFLILRYVVHLQFIILQVSFFETTWPISVCTHFVKFAGAANLCTNTVAELVMILRVYAIYHRSMAVLAFLLCILIGQIVSTAWGLHFGIPVQFPPGSGLPGCVLTGSNNFFAALWAAPLVTDSCIFIITLYRTITLIHNRNGRTTILDIIVRDGIMYFAVIFSSNLLNTLIFFLAAPDLKATAAPFGQIMTVIMITRLQLNLKNAHQKQLSAHADMEAQHPLGGASSMHFAHVHRARLLTEAVAESTFFSVGNLGEDIHDSVSEDMRHKKRGERERERAIELMVLDRDG